MKNIDENLKGITTVSIAHRMEAIENYDIIYLLEDGKIVEHGRYEEMMARKTYFFKFAQGYKFKTIDQVSNAMIKKVVMKLLGIKK
jgi:ABC-type multidrug transport system fused ATPase/permease subunit